MKVEIYSDLVCPWCYVGERRFGRALAEFAGGEEVDVVFRPFQLDPDAPASAVPLTGYLEKRFGKRAEGLHGPVDAAAAGEGIQMEWDRALMANTRTAHRLLQLAEAEKGAVVQRALVERLFALHFTRGGDISSPSELAAEAGAVGMDAEAVRAYLESDEGMEELEARFLEARQMGVRAVPTFVFEGKWAVEGAQAKERFSEVLEQVARAVPTRETDGGESSGGCADGACEI
jgi:predicted DsbA family dithiol-disulfide isomerase